MPTTALTAPREARQKLAALLARRGERWMSAPPLATPQGKRRMHVTALAASRRERSRSKGGPGGLAWGAAEVRGHVAGAP